MRTRPRGCALSCSWSSPTPASASGALLDIGAGSGVLAIAAAKLGFDPVLALDHESESVLAAGDNAARERRRARRRAGRT